MVKNKGRCKCKELIDESVFNKAFIWNPSNCECDWNILCDFSEYLDYENCKCWNRLVNKLVEECNETFKEASLVNEINSRKGKLNSCILYIVLLLIFFTVNVGIGAYFVYYK